MVRGMRGVRGAGWRRALEELAVPALTTTFGVQLLRLFVSTVVSVERDRLLVPLAGLAATVLGVALLGGTAPLVARALGPRGGLWLAAGGTGVTRLAIQLVPEPLARWALSGAGVVLFCWSIPLYLRAVRGTPAGRRLGLGLLTGLALDTALLGLWGTYDYAWQGGVAAAVLAATLAAAQLAAVWRLARSGPAPAGEVTWTLALPLAGVGPALFLHALVLQNLPWQTVLGRHRPAGAFFLVMLANLLALVAGVAVATARGQRVDLRPGTGGGRLVTAAAVTLLLVAALQAETEATSSLLLGQPALGALLVMACWQAGAAGSGQGLARTGTAWSAGVLAFFLLGFLYYAGYDTALPFENAALFPAAAALVAITAVAGQLGEPAAATRLGAAPAAGNPGHGAAPAAAWLPAGLGAALLLAPLAFQATLPGAVAAPQDGLPVRVLSYNLHFGFRPDGWSDLEAVARDVEASGPEVVALQEVSRGWYVNGATDMLGWLTRRLRMPYAVFGGAADAVWGNAILSRYPVVASGVVPLPRGGAPMARSLTWARVDLGGGRTLRVVSTHLHHTAGAHGDRIRLAQARALVEHLGREPATVVMGDFNATPGTPVAAELRRAGFVDAFEAAGGAPADGPTYASGDRIDYVWSTPDLRASDFRATPRFASDHRGVAVTLSASTAG